MLSWHTLNLRRFRLDAVDSELIALQVSKKNGFKNNLVCYSFAYKLDIKYLARPLDAPESIGETRANLPWP